MAKKVAEETPVVSGLKETTQETVISKQPTKVVFETEVVAEVETPGHSTRAYRG